MEDKGLKGFIYCICLAFTAQVVVVALIQCLSSESVAQKQAEISSIFSMQGGISKETILQFLLVAFLTAVIRSFFMSDLVIKNASLSIRMILLFVSEIVMIGIAIWQFEWFHSFDKSSLIGFVISFSICFTLSIILTIKGEKKKNDDMNEALHKVQKSQGEKITSGVD